MEYAAAINEDVWEIMTQKQKDDFIEAIELTQSSRPAFHRVKIHTYTQNGFYYFYSEKGGVS